MLEDLKSILKDDSLHLFLGQIKRLHLAPDKSSLKVDVEVWPEMRTIVAEMTWDSVGPNSGFYAFPAVGDAVLCGSAEGSVDFSYVLKRLSSEEDTIPGSALTGDSVLKALSGKKLWNTSDTRLNLSRGDTEPTENVVLGQAFKDAYSLHLGKITDSILKIVDIINEGHLQTHIGNLGYPTGAPTNIAAINVLRDELTGFKDEILAIKTDTVDTEDILSDLAFSEK